MNDQEIETIKTMICKSESELHYLYSFYCRLDEEFKDLCKRIQEIEDEQDNLSEKMKKICPHVFKLWRKIDGTYFVECKICHILLDGKFDGHNKKVYDSLKDKFQKNTTNDFMKTKNESDDEQGKE